MKKNCLILILTSLSFFINAQENKIKELPINISYYGYNAFNPGIKIGTQLQLKTWNKQKRRKEIIKHKTFFLTPQIGGYINPKSHSALLLNTEFGIETSKIDRRFYCARSLGLGFLTQFNSGITYSLQEDGTIKKKTISTTGYLMASLNYEIGQYLTPYLTWFGKTSIASKLFYNTGVSVSTFLELGVKFKLKH